MFFKYKQKYGLEKNEISYTEVDDSQLCSKASAHRGEETIKIKLSSIIESKNNFMYLPMTPSKQIFSRYIFIEK